MALRRGNYAHSTLAGNGGAVDGRKKDGHSIATELPENPNPLQRSFHAPFSQLESRWQYSGLGLAGEGMVDSLVRTIALDSAKHGACAGRTASQHKSRTIAAARPTGKLAKPTEWGRKAGPPRIALWTCMKTPEGFATLLVLHGVRLENAPQENVRVEQVCDERDSAWAVGARLCEQAHLELVEADELAHADLLCDGDGLERFVNDVDPLGRHELGEDEEPCTRLVVLAHDARLVGDRSMDIGRNEDRSHQAEVKLLRSSGRNREWGQHIAADET
eukprot:659920-Pleurochrysis_carterae.AAC.5